MLVTGKSVNLGTVPLDQTFYERLIETYYLTTLGLNDVSQQSRKVGFFSHGYELGCVYKVTGSQTVRSLCNKIFLHIGCLQVFLYQLPSLFLVDEGRHHSSTPTKFTNLHLINLSNKKKTDYSFHIRFKSCDYGREDKASGVSPDG